jgi:hypothetical protein
LGAKSVPCEEVLDFQVPSTTAEGTEQKEQEIWWDPANDIVMDILLPEWQW